jgi:hypothetical protein
MFGRRVRIDCCHEPNAAVFADNKSAGLQGFKWPYWARTTDPCLSTCRSPRTRMTPKKLRGWSCRRAGFSPRSRRCRRQRHLSEANLPRQVGDRSDFFATPLRPFTIETPKACVSRAFYRASRTRTGLESVSAIPANPRFALHRFGAVRTLDLDQERPNLASLESRGRVCEPYRRPMQSSSTRVLEIELGCD